MCSLHGHAGIVEAIALTIFIGFACDYCVHVAQIHRAAPTSQPGGAAALERTLAHAGPSLFGAALTTAGSALPLLLCNLFVFRQMGEFIAVRAAPTHTSWRATGARSTPANGCARPGRTPPWTPRIRPTPSLRVTAEGRRLHTRCARCCRLPSHSRCSRPRSACSTSAARSARQSSRHHSHGPLMAKRLRRTTARWFSTLRCETARARGAVQRHGPLTFEVVINSPQAANAHQ